MGNRFRLVLGTLLLVAGGLLLVQSTSRVPTIVHWLGNHAGQIVIASGVVLAGILALQAGARAGPALLVASGAIIWLAQSGSLSDWSGVQRLGGAAAAVAGVAMLSELRFAEEVRVDPVRTVTSLILTRTLTWGPQPAPSLLRVRAWASLTHVDLHAMHPGNGDIVEVSVSAWAARVELTLPADWIALPGRLSATTRVRLGGAFDHVEPVNFIDLNARREIARLAEAFAEQMSTPKGHRKVAVVVNVRGALAHVIIQRQ